MTKYIVKTNKDKEERYHHHIFDETGNIINLNAVLETGDKAEDFLVSCAFAIEPLMKTYKINSLESKMEVQKE